MKNQVTWILSLLALCVFSTSAVASTDDPTSSSSANLINLTYYPHAGNLIFYPSFSSSFHDMVGANQESFNNLTLYAEYGLLFDGLRLSISESDDLSTQSSSLNGFTGSNSGLSDPTLAVNYRFIDSTPGGFSADAEISTSPSLGDATYSQIGLPGSNAKGYGTLGVSAAAFWSVPKNDIKLTAGITREFSGNGNTQNSNGDLYIRSSHWVEGSELVNRFHLTPVWYVQGEADFLFGSSAAFTYSNGYAGNADYTFHVEPELELGYLVSKQTMIDVFVKYEDYENTFNDGINPITTTPVRNTLWGFTTRFEF